MARGAAAAAGLTLDRDAAGLRLMPEGDWVTAGLEAVLEPLSAADASLGEGGAVTLDLSALGQIDTAGAWLLARTTRRAEGAGNAVQLVGADRDVAALIETVGKTAQPCPPPPKEGNAAIELLARIGQNVGDIGTQARDILGFLGLSVIAVGKAVAMPWTLRWTALTSHIERAGINALPIVGLISFLIGVVLAYQGASQLARFGAQIFTVNLVAVGVLREMGILLTSIIVAGRSGSAFTAQIGTMKVNEEIDALLTIGLDPVRVLVVPRILALTIVLPLLTFYADIMGILGGAVMAYFSLDLSFAQYFRQLGQAATINHFVIGIVKAPLFGFIIGMIGCYEGLKVSRSAESVGLRTTAAVVEAIFLVIVLDALFSILFAIMGV